MRILILMAICALVAGCGAVVGALTIGVAEELSLLVLDPPYRSAIGFVAILLVLTLRPRGLLGERAY
jgi:branched-chain amino acid transport system permease protein